MVDLRILLRDEIEALYGSRDSPRRRMRHFSVRRVVASILFLVYLRFRVT